MDEFDVPIFKKAYDLYKSLHGMRNAVPKQDRHSLWQRVEQTSLQIIEHLLLAGQRSKDNKREPLEGTSVQLNLLRVLLRLAKDTKAIDLKKYVALQQSIDEIGRMLGGWIKSLPSPSVMPPPAGIFEAWKLRRKCRARASQTLEFALSSQLLLRLARPSLMFTLE